MKHTSKPWRIEDDEFHKQIVAVDEKGPWVVASVNLCMGSESIANANLIAAAPDLKEFLDNFIAQFDCLNPYLNMKQNVSAEQINNLVKQAAVLRGKIGGYL